MAGCGWGTSRSQTRCLALAVVGRLCTRASSMVRQQLVACCRSHQYRIIVTHTCSVFMDTVLLLSVLLHGTFASVDSHTVHNAFEAIFNQPMPAHRQAGGGQTFAASPV